MTGNDGSQGFSLVMPMQMGIYRCLIGSTVKPLWIPAFAGMTDSRALASLCPWKWASIGVSSVQPLSFSGFPHSREWRGMTEN